MAGRFVYDATEVSDQTIRTAIAKSDCEVGRTRNVNEEKTNVCDRQAIGFTRSQVAMKGMHERGSKRHDSRLKQLACQTVGCSIHHA